MPGPNKNFESVGADEVSISNVGDSATLSTDQTVSTGTEAKIAFDTTDIVTFDGWDTANHKYVAPADGVYLAYLAQKYRNGLFSAGDELQGKIKVNGTLERFNRHIIGSTATDYHLTPTRMVLSLSENDEVEFYTQQDRGGDEVLSADGRATFAEVMRLG